MFVTIWMCTQEWSLISIRVTALTLATCHQRLQLRVGVDALDQPAELAVAALGDADPHPRDRLRGREARLALGLRRGRLLDPLLDLGSELAALGAAGVGHGGSLSPVVYGPAETLTRTGDPGSIRVPPAGACATTVPAGSDDGTSKTPGVSPSFAIVRVASARERPTTPATITRATGAAAATASPCFGLRLCFGFSRPTTSRTLPARRTLGGGARRLLDHGSGRALAELDPDAELLQLQMPDRGLALEADDVRHEQRPVGATRHRRGDGGSFRLPRRCLRDGRLDLRLQLARNVTAVRDRGGAGDRGEERRERERDREPRRRDRSPSRRRRPHGPNACVSPGRGRAAGAAAGGS